MILPLVLYFSLTGWCAGEPPLRPHKSIPGLPRVDAREYLRDTRRAIAIVESTIEMLETSIIVLQDPPERAGKKRRDLDELREHVRFMKKEVQVLEWGEEQRKVNPESATEREITDRLEQVSKEEKAWKAAWKKGLIAPPPREKK